MYKRVLKLYALTFPIAFVINRRYSIIYLSQWLTSGKRSHNTLSHFRANLTYVHKFFFPSTPCQSSLEYHHFRLEINARLIVHFLHGRHSDLTPSPIECAPAKLLMTKKGKSAKRTRNKDRVFRFLKCRDL